MVNAVLPELNSSSNDSSLGRGKQARVIVRGGAQPLDT
ncbi:unnamed protein product, partial [Heterotrigona itama]